VKTFQKQKQYQQNKRKLRGTDKQKFFESLTKLFTHPVQNANINK